MNRKLNHAIASLVLIYSATAWSQQNFHTTMATLDGRDEYRLSGSTECGEATLEATIKPGERFIASCELRSRVVGIGPDRRPILSDVKDCDVYLKSGISGSIPRNRIRLLPDEPLARLNFDSCKKEWRKLQSKPVKKTDDVAYSAKKYHGVANYYRTLVQASEGDAKAFGRLSSLLMDGEAGDENDLNLHWPLLHVAGDDTFAKLLAGQSPEFREGYAEFFSKCCAPISNTKPYIKLHFPKTYAILYGR